jgi:hypothetical protein
MNLRKADAVLLLVLLLVVLAIFFVLRDFGFTLRSPRPPAPTQLAASAASSGPAGTASPAAFDDVVKQLEGAHRALEAGPLAAAGVTRLKSLYLECARETSHSRRDVEQAAFCQAVADALMHGHSGGSFERLIGWWRAVGRES